VYAHGDMRHASASRSPSRMLRDAACGDGHDHTRSCGDDHASDVIDEQQTRCILAGMVLMLLGLRVGLDRGRDLSDGFSVL
jgi:hypothetical protein